MKHAAGVILVHPNGSVLMQHRDNIPNVDYPDHWGIPGGVVEKGELFEKAAKREFFEETGYKVENLMYLKSSVCELEDGAKVTHHVYWAIYDEKQIVRCLEGQAMKFLGPKELFKLKIRPGHKELFELAVCKAREGRFLQK